MDRQTQQRWHIAVQERYQQNQRWSAALAKRVKRAEDAMVLTFQLCTFEREQRQKDAFAVYTWLLRETSRSPVDAVSACTCVVEYEEALATLIESLTTYVTRLQQYAALSISYRTSAAQATWYHMLCDGM